MTRTEMINLLCQNLRHMNAGRQGTEAFVAEERERYEAMSSEQLRGMILMNF